MEAGRVGRRGKEKTFLRSKKAAERVAPPVGRRRGFEDRSTRKDVDRTGLLMEAATIGSGQRRSSGVWTSTTVSGVFARLSLLLPIREADCRSTFFRFVPRCSRAEPVPA